MADITMCLNKECPKIDKCYRANATPNPFWQSWSKFENCNSKTGYDDFILTKDNRLSNK